MRKLGSIVLALVCMLAMGSAVPAAGQSDPGAFSSFSGQLSSPSQVDRIAFEVDSDTLQVGDDGDVGLAFVLHAAPGSDLDPGLIGIEPHGSAEVGGARKPDTAGSTASLALASLAPGSYELVVRGEHGTTGAYRLDVHLAGDADGDLTVDLDDLQVISDLSGARLGDTDYSVLADVDRNGVVNGGDRQRAAANLGAMASGDDEVVNPLDVFLPPDALRLVGLSPTGFNSRTGPLRFSLTGAEFEQELADVTLTINGFAIVPGLITVGPNLLSANINLTNGRNDIALKTYDHVGRPLYLKETVWAGSSTLQVRLVHPDGSAFLEPATVTAKLSDDQEVGAEASTSSGSVAFSNLPARTILVQAKGSGNQLGTAGVLATDGFATVVMHGFGEPSDIDNNDLTLGIAGWDVGTAPVAIVPHLEDIPGFSSASAPVPPTRLSERMSLVDNDLQLGTAGEGEQSISRTFESEPGVTGVRVRYRFITSEVPGGWFGSEFNDYFRVSIRSQGGGGAESEHNSMNGLGLGAFHFASGSTDWREIELPLDREGDTVQVDIAVANVADGFLDSLVVVDFVEELRNVVHPQLAWNNTMGGLNLTWTVDEELGEDVEIEVYWASGTTYGSRIGDPIFTQTVPAGTAAGMHGPTHIPGGGLANDPAGVTHLIAASSETEVGAVADVAVAYGANADAGAVSAAMLDVVKDALRAAGQSNATITSTARTPVDQARAMFQNLVNPAHTIAENVQEQLDLYAAPGDAVVRVFEAEAAGLTRPEVVAMAAAIQDAMVTEINNQGPSRVSRHCADPATVSVVDVSRAPFNAQNRPLFRASATPRVGRFIDEPQNNCFHLELAVAP